MELAVLRECYKCHVQKPLEEYTKRENGPDGLHFYCKSCVKIRSDTYLATLDGYITKLLYAAKHHAKTRKNRGREDAGVFDLNRNDVKALWESQNGKCFYSKIKMSIKQNTDWQCSLERIDPDKGYIVDNVALCCQEFNGAVQWSIEKINSIKDAIKIDYVLPEYDYYPATNHVKTKSKVEKKLVNGIEYIKCNKCNIFKPKEEHLPKNGCKACKKLYDDALKETPRRHILSLLNSAQQSQHKRNIFCDISYEDLVDIFKKQNGLCAYSKIPMAFGSYKDKDWICSLERKDVKEGYVKDNVCLICFEWNTGDRTNSSNKEDVQGGAGWNEEKFKYFLESINA